MIDLTPLDVRKKRGDFRRGIRGYDAEEVDQFLSLVSERMEELVRENLELKERVERLGQQVDAQEGREHAVKEALVTAQELRDEIREQARHEADLIRREAEMEAKTIRRDAEQAAERLEEASSRRLEDGRRELRELSRARLRFLRNMRGLLERELDALEVEEERSPEEDFPEGVVEAGSGGDGQRERGASGQEADPVPFTFESDEDDDETVEQPDETRSKG
jgi:cell division initiation protein